MTLQDIKSIILGAFTFGIYQHYSNIYIIKQNHHKFNEKLDDLITSLKN